MLHELEIISSNSMAAASTNSGQGTGGENKNDFLLSNWLSFLLDRRGGTSYIKLGRDLTVLDLWPLATVNMEIFF